MPFLVHREVEHLVDLMQALLPHVVGLDLVHERRKRRVVGQQLHELAVLRRAAFNGEQLLARLEPLVLRRQVLLGLAHHPAREPQLLLVEAADERVVFLERGRGIASHRP